MSQHFYTSRYQGRTVTVLMGWDRPLQGYFMVVVFNRDDDLAYSNLDDPALVPWQGFPPTLEHFVRKADELGLQVPADVFEQVELDGVFNVGNRYVTHDAVAPDANKDR